MINRNLSPKYPPITQYQQKKKTWPITEPGRNNLFSHFQLWLCRGHYKIGHVFVLLNIAKERQRLKRIVSAF